MAHPCFQCGSECYCSGDWDDVIVSKTPKRCEGCGCEEMFNDDDFDDDDYENDFYEQRAGLAATCKCGAWKFAESGEVLHVGDCVCGAE